MKKNTWAEELENKDYFRKIIKNTFCGTPPAKITYKFPKKIHAVTDAGFLLIAIIAIILHKHFE